MIDSQGRIVFDSSDDTDLTDTIADKKRSEDDAEVDLQEEENLESDVSQLQSDIEALRIEEPEQEDDPQDVEIDLTGLRQRFFPNLNKLDELDVCPSLKQFELGDPSGSMDIPFLKAPEDWRDDQDVGRLPGAFGDNSGMLIDGDMAMGFDDDELGLGSFDIGDDVAFGEGGEAWAREAALEPQMRVYDSPIGEDGGDEDAYDENGDYVISVSNPQNADKMHQDILSFFDQALQKNWTSAEHWRIRKIKDTSKPVGDTPKKRKEKEPFEIDFGSALDSTLTDALYTQAASNSTICMAKKDWKSKSRNLLPDDKHFSSKSLLSLFLKPRARLTQRSTGTHGASRMFGGNHNETNGNQPLGELDEAFWAQQKAPEETALPGGDYDANFFQDDMPFAGGNDDDDDDDDMEFADAQEHLGAGAGVDMGLTENIGSMTAMFGGETISNPMAGAFGDTLVATTRRVRPEYVQYARVAKKVDIRRLKDEIWKGMGLEKLPVCLYHYLLFSAIAFTPSTKMMK